MIKRFFDLIISFTCLLIFLPFFAIISFLLILDSPGPIFYRGVRTGLSGRPFKIFKFRSMVANAERMGGPSTALDDKRLTKFGKILRKYKIDELPQLINVLKGEMSIVGPRPQVETYTKLYSEEEKVILTVKPGITDYASVRFINLDAMLGNDDVDARYRREVEPLKNKLRIKYAKSNSLMIDLKIIFITILQLVRVNFKWNIVDSEKPI